MRGLNATQWQAALSTAGRLIDDPDVAYVRSSEHCRVLVSERWNGTEWVAERLVWDGESYVWEVK